MRCAVVVPRIARLSTRAAIPPQVPLGHLLIASELRRRGHSATLIDADLECLSIRQTLQRVAACKPSAVLVGHPASTIAHMRCMELFRCLRQASSTASLIYGGVHPTYHPDVVFRNPEMAPDYLVQHEAERVCADLVDRLEDQSPALSDLPGVVSLARGAPQARAASPIQVLDDFAPSWDAFPEVQCYRAFGMPSAVVQFSRGCPRRCGYCGQFMFWKSWRHRSVESFAAEIDRLAHSRTGVLWIADENWSVNPAVFHDLLRALARNRRRPHLIVAMEGAHLIRDRHDFGLYREAGISMVMVGFDAGEQDAYGAVGKRAPPTQLSVAMRAMCDAGIAPIVNAFIDENTQTQEAFRQLSALDAPYYNLLFPTPHAWTEFGKNNASRVCHESIDRWDYRHPVLGASAPDLLRQSWIAKLLEVLLHTQGFTRLLRSRQLRKNRLAVEALPLTAMVFLVEVGEQIVRAAWSAYRYCFSDPSQAMPGASGACQQDIVEGMHDMVTESARRNG
ncbi:MAG: cobalamin-dependent protein [Candidatus Sumerlaeia bacterium]|nr:cobalamin-dependent protein [Candidatus Sumerlaeia bacterium]